MAIFYTDSGSFGDITVSGSAIVSGTLSFAANSGGLTGSLLGTSSWASNAQSASFVEFTSIVNKPELVSSSGQITITSTVGYSTFSSSIATKNDLQDISITALNTATSSYAINSTIQSQLAGVVSSSTQVKTLLPTDIVSSSAQVKTFLPPDTVSSSGQITITSTTGYSTFSSSIATKNDTQDISISALNAATSSYAINSTIQSQLAGVVSSSTQVKLLLPTDTVSSSAQVKTFLPPDTVSSSGQVSITQTTGYSTFSSSIATKNDTQDISINALNTATSSYAINSTIQSQLAGVVSSSTQVKTLLPADTVSSSAFTSPSQGTVRATINGAQTDVDTGLQTVDSPTFTGLTVTTTSSIAGHYSSSAQVVAAIVGQTIVPLNLTVTQVTASIISASTSLTASTAQFTNLTDTTATNKVLVINTSTGNIFTTASVGTGGASTPGFPFSGSAVITGSLYVTSSVANPVTITGSVNDYFELEIINANAGNAASTDIVASNNATTDFGNYIDMGINGTAYAGALVGGPSDGYLYFTSSVGELHVGNASIGNSSNVRLFAGGPTSDATTRVFISGSGNVGIGTTTPNEKLVIVGNQTLTGSVSIEGNGATDTLINGTNTLDSFTQVAIQNLSATTNASTDFVVNSNNATADTNFADFGINSSTFVGLIGNANDAYLYITSSQGELVIGNASAGAKSNVRLFTGAGDTDNVTRVFISSSGNVGIGTSIPSERLVVNGNMVLSGSLFVSSSQAITASNVQLNNLTNTTSANRVLVIDTTTNKIFTTASVGTGGGPAGAAFPYNGETVPAVISGSLIVSGSRGIYLSGSALTGSIFSGSFFNILEMSMAVSGTITASGTTTVTLDLNKTNYYTISGSGAGTVTWVVNNPPPIGRAQTFILDYTNGGGKTNSWFTNTRWPGGVAPTLTSGSTSPDILSFTTDDAGSNWRGVLLQRASQ